MGTTERRPFTVSILIGGCLFVGGTLFAQWLTSMLGLGLYDLMSGCVWILSLSPAIFFAETQANKKSPGLSVIALLLLVWVYYSCGWWVAEVIGINHRPMALTEEGAVAIGAWVISVVAASCTIHAIRHFAGAEARR